MYRPAQFCPYCQTIVKPECKCPGCGFTQIQEVKK